jgi:hypothetical protein
MPKSARADITEQFFRAGDLMELAPDSDDFDLDDRRPAGASGVHGWLALAAASALGLLVLVVLTI